MTNDEFPMTKAKTVNKLGPFGHWCFDILSTFVIRISSFSEPPHVGCYESLHDFRMIFSASLRGRWRLPIGLGNGQHLPSTGQRRSRCDAMTSSDQNRLLISNLISVATIELNLRGSQRDDALTELVARIPEIASRPEARQTLLRALQEREALHSTGIGDGVALPHARNALVGLVEKPVIVFGRHSQGIPYGSIDAQPAKLFFLLVTTTVPQHLQILARISRLVRDSRLRQGLLLADKPEKVLTLVREAEAKM
jgi:PTS system nitrogen regulatory IIA component